MKLKVGRSAVCLSVVLLLLSSAFALAEDESLTVPLVYSLQEDAEEAAAEAAIRRPAALVKVETFIDVRSDPRKIGENTEEDRPVPVYADSNVAAFCTAVAKVELRRLGLRVGDTGFTHVLSGEVTHFFVREKDEYSGTSVVRFTLRTSTGKLVWEGSARGDATNSGRSLNEDNYQETFSEALHGMFESLSRQEAFWSALKPVPLEPVGPGGEDRPPAAGPSLVDQAYRALSERNYAAARDYAVRAAASGADPTAVERLQRDIEVGQSLERMRAAIERSDWAQAEAAGRRLSALDPDNPEGMRLRALIPSREDRGSAERQALLAFYSGEYQTAVALLEELLSDRPSAKLHFYAGCSYAAMGFLKPHSGELLNKAKEHFLSTRSLSPNFRYDSKYISPRVLELFSRTR
jgi:hypothetical protein